jgi:CBS domain-containing protein
MLLFIALFVWMGAAQEANLALTRLNLSGATVRRAMITRFEALSPYDSLAFALRLAIDGAQKDFPILDQGRLVGVLGREEMLQGLSAIGIDGSVGAAMRPAPEPLALTDPLADVLDRMQAEQVACLPVLHEGRLVGLLTIENLREFLLVRDALRDRPRTFGPPWINGRPRDEAVTQG